MKTCVYSTDVTYDRFCVLPNCQLRYFSFGAATACSVVPPSLLLWTGLRFDVDQEEVAVMGASIVHTFWCVVTSTEEHEAEWKPAVTRDGRTSPSFNLALATHATAHKLKCCIFRVQARIVPLPFMHSERMLNEL